MLSLQNYILGSGLTCDWSLNRFPHGMERESDTFLLWGSIWRRDKPLFWGPCSSKRLVFCAVLRLEKTAPVQLTFCFLFFFFFPDIPSSKSSVTLSDLAEFLGGLSFEDSAEKDREEGNVCPPYLHLAKEMFVLLKYQMHHDAPPLLNRCNI